MNLWFYLFLSVIVVFCSCTSDRSKTGKSSISEASIIPEHYVSKDSLSFNREINSWTFKGSLFYGYAITKFIDGSIRQKVGILNGKFQNELVNYFPNGQVKSLHNYDKGQLHGVKKNWVQDSTYMLISSLNYYRGKPHGIQKKWYPTGEIFTIRILNMGREEGIQQAFRKNGVLYANYEAKNGRIFGMKKATLCFEIEDGEIKRAKEE